MYVDFKKKPLGWNLYMWKPIILKPLLMFLFRTFRHGVLGFVSHFCKGTRRTFSDQDPLYFRSYPICESRLQRNEADFFRARPGQGPSHHITSHFLCLDSFETSLSIVLSAPGRVQSWPWPWPWVIGSGKLTEQRVRRSGGVTAWVLLMSNH